MYRIIYSLVVIGSDELHKRKKNYNDFPNGVTQ